MLVAACGGSSPSPTAGYANPQTVYNRLSGTITWLPSVGQVIEPALFDSLEVLGHRAGRMLVGRRAAAGDEALRWRYAAPRTVSA